MPALTDLHLMRPEWLWGLLPGLFLILLLWRQHGRRGSWSEVIAPELLPFLIGDQRGTRAPNLLPVILLAWILACLAAAGPSWQKLPQPIIQKQDALVLALDLSLSMKAADLPPSRIDRARQKLLDLLSARQEGQTGLIAFAGDSHIVTPLTDDNPTIANLLPALHPDMMPVAGSDAAAAIVQARDLLHSAGIRNGRILLVTDGVSSSQHAEISDTLTDTDIALSILAVGTEAGAPIPLPRGGFLKDSSGTIVIPRLETSSLSALAGLTAGRLREIQIDDSDLSYLLQERTLPGDGETLTLDRTADAWEDQGYWIVLLLLPIALAMFRRGWLVCLTPLLFLSNAEPARAQVWDNLWLTPDQQGQRALQAGDNERAQGLFERRDWAGTAAYRNEDYEGALQYFDEPVTGDDWYNRGNALARVGNIDDAIEAYKESLAIDPGKTDAEENLALLEQLKNQQQQQQNQDNESQDQQDQDPQEQQDQSQQNQQSQDQQDQQNREQNESESNQDQQDSGEQEPQQDSPQDQAEPQDEGQEEKQEQQPAQQPEQEQQQEQPAQAEASPEDQERDQAMEQWLRRVPDDPSGLLREKFRYESRQREAEGKRRSNDSNW